MRKIVNILTSGGGGGGGGADGVGIRLLRVASSLLRRGKGRRDGGTVGKPSNANGMEDRRENRHFIEGLRDPTTFTAVLFAEDR